jgi:polyisoprenoid-binding protein YceI
MLKSNFLLSAALMVVGLFTFAFTYAPITYKVDTAASVLDWKGYKVTGAHAGVIQLKNGALQFEGEKLIGGNFEIDMNSITCTDLQGEYAAKLVGHLKADDFFGTAKFGTAKFVMTKAASQGKDLYKITGKMTIKNVTKEIRFNANVNEVDGKKVATAAIKVDRTDYNVRYGSGTFFDNLGDKTIYDEFDFNVKLVATK